jgi:hypothetical protein
MSCTLVTNKKLKIELQKIIDYCYYDELKHYKQSTILYKNHIVNSIEYLIKKFKLDS